MKTMLTLIRRGVFNAGFFCLGLVVLVINKVRYAVFGYTTPRPFSVGDAERVIASERTVIDGWREAFARYTGRDGMELLRGKTVLEIGPGEDMGTALLGLAQGARRYCAFDVNDLARIRRDDFYEVFFSDLERQSAIGPERLTMLRGSLERALSGTDDVHADIVFRVADRFDEEFFQGKGIDVVVSQAAWEHIEDVDDLLRRMSGVVVPGAVLVAEIDLATHTRWLRERDVLNIYRYPSWLWRWLSFRGAPNRIRPDQYRELLERYGWERVDISPKFLADAAYYETVKGSLAPNYRSEERRMQCYGIVVCATKKNA